MDYLDKKIDISGPLLPTESNCPTRVGEIVENVSDIYNIPSPRLGMQVFVKSEKKSFVVTKLKSKVINGVDVPEAAVETFELVGAKAITWNNDTDPSNMNDFVVAGVYDIKGEHTRVDDNLPILNTGSGHSFNARLTVLDSSISGSGNIDDKCITQVLSFSNRLGQGEVYIRTGKGSSLNNLTWEKWSTLQRNVNVDYVESLDDLKDNGIYSGVWSRGHYNTYPITFVCVVINDYSIGVAPRRISQFVYGLSKYDGSVVYQSRVWDDSKGRWNEWAILNQTEISLMIKSSVDNAIKGVIADAPEAFDTLKEIADWIANDKTGAVALAQATKANADAIHHLKNNMDFRMLEDGVDLILYQEPGESPEILAFLSPADESLAGVMSAADKQKLNAELPINYVVTPAKLDFNDYTDNGIYNIETAQDTINSPVLNNSMLRGRLTVLVTESGSNKVITQVLNLNNNEGGEGNVYIRSCQNGEWKAWGKLQANVEVGLVNQQQMDDLVDNGIYSGILSTTGETFVIICINNYAIAQQVGVHHISHLKYSLVVGTGEVKIEKRTRDAYGFWTEWENIGSGSSISEATTEVAGAVKLGKSTNGGWLPICNIDSSHGSGLGLKIDSAVFSNNKYEMLGLKVLNGGGLGSFSNGLAINLGTTLNSSCNAVPLCIGTPANSVEFIEWTGSYTNRGPSSIPSIPVNPNQFKLGNFGLELINPSSATKVTWDANSNMNDFKTAGVYDIYGERTRQDDNLPILNASSGHSIAARLFVVASTLQPANNEICITQFLMLSNRLGGDGNMYVRTYNENNSPAADWWTPWQKLQGIREGYIFTDSVQVNPDGGVQQITGVTGLNNMVDNGIYSGIYTDDPTFQAPTFIDTFTLIVINNYAVVGQSGGLLKRTISQLKYAVDAITNQATVKQRTITDGDTAWSDWTDIGGGGSNEVDITDAVKQYGLSTLIAQGFAKEGVTYKVQCNAGEVPVIDTQGKIASHIDEIRDSLDDVVIFSIKVYYYNDNPQVFIDCITAGYASNSYKYIIANINTNDEIVKVSSDMTAL